MVTRLSGRGPLLEADTIAEDRVHDGGSRRKCLEQGPFLINSGRSLCYHETFSVPLQHTVCMNPACVPLGVLAPFQHPITAKTIKEMRSILKGILTA
jgi:hypothetical protein